VARRGPRSVVASLLAITLLASAASAHESGLQQEYTETRQQLQDAESDLATVTEQVGTAQEQLVATDRQLVALEEKLRQHEAELARAEAAYADSRARSGEAARELERVTRRLARTQAELADRERRFDARVASAYKYGQVAYAQALLGAEDVTDFVNTMYYVRSVMRSDRGMIDDVTETARAVATDRAEADRLREQLAGEEAEARRLREQVEEAADAQRRLTRMVADERAGRAALVVELESTRASYESLVDDLEAESERLAEELRKSRFQGAKPGPGGLLWPTSGHKTSDFGWRTHPIYGGRRMHTGVDISGGVGQPIVAAATGQVVSAGWRGGYGLTVVIDHGGGMHTLYAHQSQLSVAEGTVVEQGQKIGAVGSTGNSTGPHLHFEVRINGEPRDPMGWY
jgi:murein DD-endopeptidase MepM/ murein hydrolase activator NlpD